MCCFNTPKCQIKKKGDSYEGFTYDPTSTEINSQNMYEMKREEEETDSENENENENEKKKKKKKIKKKIKVKKKQKMETKITRLRSIKPVKGVTKKV